MYMHMHMYMYMYMYELRRMNCKISVIPQMSEMLFKISIVQLTDEW